MKTRLASAALAVTALAALTACGGSAQHSTDDGSGSDTDLASLASVSWDEGTLGAPELSFGQPFTLDAAAALRIVKGDGDAVVQGNLISISYIVYDGSDGSVVYSSYDSGGPETVSYTPDTFATELTDLLDDGHVGDQILYASPGQTSTTTGEDATYVLAMTVVGVAPILTEPSGEAVDPDPSLPVVSFDETGTASLAAVGGTPPSELVVQPLIVGTGAPVQAGQTVIADYAGWLWDGTLFDTSYGATPLEISLDSLIQGWGEGLVGQPLGSRVLLVIPPDLGYGADDNGSIPGGSTLVFVVDLLAAY